MGKIYYVAIMCTFFGFIGGFLLFHEEKTKPFYDTFYYDVGLRPESWVVVRKNIDTLRLCGKNDTTVAVIDSVLAYPDPKFWSRCVIDTTWVK